MLRGVLEHPEPYRGHAPEMVVFMHGVLYQFTKERAAYHVITMNKYLLSTVL